MYSPAELEAYYASWDAVSTEKSLLSDRYEEGLGIGKAERNIEIAKKMLLRGMERFLISEMTGLREAEICKLTDVQELEYIDC